MLLKQDVDFRSKGYEPKLSLCPPANLKHRFCLEHCKKLRLIPVWVSSLFDKTYFFRT
jgi:hypothetical protein